MARFITPIKREGTTSHKAMRSVLYKHNIILKVLFDDLGIKTQKKTWVVKKKS